MRLAFLTDLGSESIDVALARIKRLSGVTTEIVVQDGVPFFVLPENFRLYSEGIETLELAMTVMREWRGSCFVYIERDPIEGFVREKDYIIWMEQQEMRGHRSELPNDPQV